MIDINPIVNQNLSGDGQANYKATTQSPDTLAASAI